MNQIDDLKLPQPTHVGWSVDGVEPVYAYTADQMREAIKQAREDEREACAKVCDENAARWQSCANDGGSDGRYDWKADAGHDCAEDIRARSQA